MKSARSTKSNTKSIGGTTKKYQQGLKKKC